MDSKILIRGGYFLLASGWVPGGYLLIVNGKIAEISSQEAPNELLPQCRVIDAKDKVVIPGLRNAHTHFSQTFMRGLAGSRPLISWLKERIWPLQKVLSPQDVELAARLAIVESIRCGVTHITDHHKITQTDDHTLAVCRAAEALGVPITLARAWSDMGPDSESPAHILSHLESLFSTWGNHPLVRIANGPLSAWRCSAETLRATHELAIQHDSFSHIHISESRDEVEKGVELYGETPINWLNTIGLLDERMQLVHSVWAEEDELQKIAETGSTVIHCPVSNAVLGSGIAPVKRMMDLGIPIFLGTDGPASNDTQDVFETMKAALMIARASTLDANALSPRQALSLSSTRGYLSTGESANLIVVDIQHVRAIPVHDLDSALVLSSHGSDVSSVIVKGEILLQEKKVLIEDEDALVSECRKAAAFITRKLGI